MHQKERNHLMHELTLQYANVTINISKELLAFPFFITLYGTMVTHDLLERKHKISLGP